MSDLLVRDDFEEFNRHHRSGGWQLGLLVARNTFRGRPTDKANLAAVDKGKVSTSEAAVRAEVSQSTIIRYLSTWDSAATHLGVVPHSTSLFPGDKVELDREVLPAWSTEGYDEEEQAELDALEDDDELDYGHAEVIPLSEQITDAFVDAFANGATEEEASAAARKVNDDAWSEQDDSAVEKVIQNTRVEGTSPKVTSKVVANMVSKLNDYDPAKDMVVDETEVALNRLMKIINKKLDAIVEMREKQSGITPEKDWEWGNDTP